MKIEIKFEGDIDGALRQEVLEIALEFAIFPYSSKEDDGSIVFKDTSSKILSFKQRLISEKIDCSIINMLD